MKVFIVYTMTFDGINKIYEVFANKSDAEAYAKQKDLEYWDRMTPPTKAYFNNDINNFPSNYYIHEYIVRESM